MASNLVEKLTAEGKGEQAGEHSQSYGICIRDNIFSVNRFKHT